jgi:hypothetical protein
MKCDKCIFAQEINSEMIRCYNMSSDDYLRKLFAKYDGCQDGKASTVGLSKQEIAMLQHMNSQGKE